MIEENTIAPNFALPNHEGKTVSLEDHRGSWVVLYAYPKDDTPGCTKEACAFTDALDQFELLDAVIFGVSPDSSESHAEFRQKFSLKVELLADENKEVLKAYGAWGIKNNYGRKSEGVIRSTFLISPAGKIVKIWRNVRVNGHADKVREVLENASKSGGGASS